MTRYQALQPHEQRVVAEYKELREWHAKLCAFIASGTFITLPEEDRELMVIQENLMDSLSFVLARRIRRFTRWWFAHCCGWQTIERTMADRNFQRRTGALMNKERRNG